MACCRWQALTREQADTIDALKQMMHRLANEGQAECRVCGRIVYGDHPSDILEALGIHGTREHPEVFTEGR